jgi:GNAT superfamily N-acetyltransferase
MLSDLPPIPDGYSPVPPGKLATIVTCLEMLEKPPRKAVRPVERPMLVERWENPPLDEYRTLFRAIGEDWLWFSRLVMPEEELGSKLNHPLVENYVLRDGKRAIGLAELDFRVEGECELGLFGLTPDATGQGSGRFLMSHMIGRAWSRPITRFWLHTCTFDSPAALGFYQRSGFTPYALMVEVAEDPRLSGHLPRTAAAHIPLAVEIAG